MKEPITKFNFEDAFKALDDIPVPTAEKGIRANRQDLHETMRRVDKFELLFEDFYDVNDSEDMNAASEEREAEVAKAKLARIEKIVDLDAETEDDILPSYVGKIIIQCPQCMTLFYKNPEDIEKDEENPDVVNVNEACQHCGNTSGYDIIGKVAEEDAQEETSDDLGTETEGGDLGNEENDLSVEDNTEEETSDEGEVDELSAEVDLDELDLEEIPEEEEEVEESLHNSEALKDAEEESNLKTENESKKLTLNEDIDEDLDAKLKAHDEYIAHLRTTIEQEEKALEAEKNEQIKTSIQGRIDTLKAELEAALPDAVKVETPAEDIEATEEETIETEEAVEETAEEAPAEETEIEETTEEISAEEEQPEEEVKEALNEGLTENAIPSTSESEINALFDSEEFKKPVSESEVESFFEEVKVVDNEKLWVDYRPAFEAIAKEVDGKFDFAVNFNVYNEKIVVETSKALEKDELAKLLDAMTNSKVAKENKWTAAYTGLENNENTKIKIQFQATAQMSELKHESVEDEIAEAEITVEGDTDPVALDAEEKEQLTEDNILNASWWNKIGYYEKILAVASNHKNSKLIWLSFIPLLKPTDVTKGLPAGEEAKKYEANKYPEYYIQTPAYSYIKSAEFSDDLGKYPDKKTKKAAVSSMKNKFNQLFDAVSPLVKKAQHFDKYKALLSDTATDIENVDAQVDHIWIVLSTEQVKDTNVIDILKKATTSSDGSVLLLGDYDAAAKNFNWTMQAVAGAGIDRIAQHQKDGTPYVADEKEEKPTGGKPKAGAEAGGESEDGKPKAGADEKVEEEEAAEVAAEGEPKTEDDRKLLLKTFVSEDKAFLPIRFSADKKSIMPLEDKPFTDIDVFEKWLRNDLQKYGAILGAPIDTAIILVDNEREFTKQIQSVPAGIDLVDSILVHRAKDGKTSTRLSAAYKDLHRIVASLNITDLDDKSFNEKLTESLKAVYENVENFTMTDCSLQESTITVTGDIKFKSGKTRNTNYIFEAVQNPDEVKLTGFNKDLFENGKIDITCQIINESLQANNLNYSYTVNGALVEGLITK